MKINFQGTAAVVNDPHIPFHDQRAIHEFELFVAELQPGLLLNLGDIGDFYALSRFDKNPRTATKLKAELTQVKHYHKRQREILPNTRIIEEDGNHDDRLRKYLWSKAAALEELDELKVPALYGLTDNEIEHVGYGEGIVINGVFMATHGDLVRAHAGYTAKGMSDKYGGSGIHGHTHRMGSYYKRDRFGIYGWWENGCLCDLNPEYIVNPNWQQGFSLVHFKGDRFWVEQVQIIKGRFMYGGKIFGSGGKKR